MGRSRPQLLNDLCIPGSIVTLDTVGSQTKIAQKIIHKQADYVLVLKGNHGQLHGDGMEWFAWATERQFQDMPHPFFGKVST
jgi:predicted transposase YbfD/YdcC